MAELPNNVWIGHGWQPKRLNPVFLAGLADPGPSAETEDVATEPKTVVITDPHGYPLLEVDNIQPEPQ